jgi:hypothetical protein
LKWQHDEKMQQLEQFREVQRLIFIVDQRWGVMLNRKNGCQIITIHAFRLLWEPESNGFPCVFYCRFYF